jgi:hypothetical protein
MSQVGAGEEAADAGAGAAVAVKVGAAVVAVVVGVKARERITDRVANMGKVRTRILPRTSRLLTAKAGVEAEAAAAVPLVVEAGSRALPLTIITGCTCPRPAIRRHRHQQMW